MFKQKFLITLTLLFILSACGSGDNPVLTENEQPEATPEQPSEGGNEESGNNSEENETTEPVEEPSEHPVYSAQNEKRVTMRRLNRSEYNRTIEHVLGVGTQPANNFPEDSIGDGFDTNGDVLSISPNQATQYFESALATAELFVGLDGLYFPGARFFGTAAENGTVAELASTQFGELTFDALESGSYTFNFNAALNTNSGETATISVTINDETLVSFDISSTNASDHSVTRTLTPGAYTIRIDVSGINNSLAVINSLHVSLPTPQPLQAEISTAQACYANSQNAASCTTNAISKIGKLLWRRPLSVSETSDHIELLESLIGSGNSFDDAISNTIAALLSSPYFIYRVELETIQTSLVQRALTGHELAARLAYFIWSSAPDETLLDLAESGALLQDQTLAQQVTRMLTDPRSRALTEDFAAQWLTTRSLEPHEPDTTLFPEWDKELWMSMEKETLLLFSDFLSSSKSFDQILTESSSYINSRLADLYNIDGVTGNDFSLTSMTPVERGGILTHASFLTVTSFPERTSLVKRGQWVLRNLLCDEPPPPPPGVEGLPESIDENLTFREQLEAHRANPICNSCHEVMDNIGFGLENFGAIGEKRSTENDLPVDSSGELDGVSFDTAAELSTIIKNDSRFSECVAKKLFTYGLGRGLVEDDNTTISSANQQWLANGMVFSSLVNAVATSDIFKNTWHDLPVSTGSAPSETYESINENMYFRGTPNVWAAAKMSLAADNVWSITVANEQSDGSFKFDLFADWQSNYGENDNDGIADPSGGNIAFNDGVGTYFITFNELTYAYSMSKTSDEVETTPPEESFTGTYPSMFFRGTPNSWSTENPMTLVADNVWQVELDITAESAEFKFDALGDWTTNFGLGEIQDIAITSGGNILISSGAGYYRIQFNDSNLSYSVNRLGDVGSGTPTEEVEEPVTEEPSDNAALIAQGKALYDEQCFMCHGSSSSPSTIRASIDLTGSEASLTSDIDLTMPATAPTQCVDDCAAATAAYLKSLVTE